MTDRSDPRRPGGPTLFPSDPLEARPGRPSSRWVNKPAVCGWDGPVLAEWELTAASWTDRHAHDELNYVLEGELVVESDAITVVAGPGDVVRVPAGALGRYTAPRHARMLAIYGPNPSGAEPTDTGFSSLRRRD